MPNTKIYLQYSDGSVAVGRKVHLLFSSGEQVGPLRTDGTGLAKFEHSGRGFAKVKVDRKILTRIKCPKTVSLIV